MSIDALSSADELLRRPSLFGPPINSPTIGAVTLMAVGDYDGDQKPDVLGRAGSDATLHLFRGAGAGKFSAAGPGIAAGLNPSAIVAADFNNDHVLDVAVANNPGPFVAVTSSVTVLLGNGDGTFRSPGASFAGNQPVALAVADFNHDGNLDVVVANRGPWNVPGTLGPASTGAGVLLGNGDGAFKTVRKIPMFEQFAVATGDVNGDGRADAVFGTDNPLVATAFPVSQLVEATGDGGGGFTTGTVAGFPGRARGIVVAELNGDKLDDIAALGVLGAYDSTTPTALGGSTVRTYLSKGDGTVTPIAAVDTGVAAPAGLSAADFNGDGRPDFAVAGIDTRFPIMNVQPGAVSVMLGLRGGVLSPPTLYRTGASPQSQVATDLNGDGRPDLLTGGAGAINTLLNQGMPVTSISVDDAVDVVMAD